MKPRTRPAVIAALATGILLFALLAYTSLNALHTQARPHVIHIFHAVMGPVYQRLPDNTTIMVKADIYYPDKLYLQPPDKLGVVNFTVYSNWSGPWDGIITVQVVDPGYHIDPTLFKPVESMFEWGEGGATLGSGALHAATFPVLNHTVRRSVVIYAHDRYYKERPGVYQAQYFFKIRLAFFDNESGQKIPGGDINMYTSSEGAPRVEVIVVKPGGRGSSLDAWELLVRNTAIATGVALVAYVIVDRVVSRRSQ